MQGYLDSLRVELLAERSPVSVSLIKPSGIGAPLAEHAAVHLEHAAKAPPPSYGVQSVVDAILQRARRPRREIVVGSAGAAQIFFGKVAPGLFDRMATLIIPLLSDRRRPASKSHNLFHPRPPWTERSRYEWTQRPSAYTTVALRPTVALGATMFVALVLASGLLRRSR